MCNGTRYSSVREAAQALGVGKNTLRRRLVNPRETGYYYLEGEQKPYGQIAIFG
jgi:hypothetical protein